LVEALADIYAEHRPSDLVSGVAFDPVAQQLWMPEIEWAERVGNTQERHFVGRLIQLVALTGAFLISLNRLFFPLRYLFPARQKRALEILARSDLAFSAPGGYLEDSNYGYVVNCIAILLACQLARCVVLAPQSIGPINSRSGRWLIRRIVRRVDRIFLREQESMAFLTQIMGGQISRKISVVGDLAFWYSRLPKSSVSEEMSQLGIDCDIKVFGITIVDWNFPGVQDREKARLGYIRSLSRLIGHVENRGSHQIVIFNQVSYDLGLAKEIKRLHPKVLVDVGERDAALHLKLIGCCDVFLGTRFHSCIFALLGHIPTTAIAYLPKTRGMMNDFGMGEFVVDINEVSGEKLIEQFEVMCKNRQRLSNIIRERLRAYRQNHDGFLRYLSAVCNK